MIIAFLGFRVLLVGVIAMLPQDCSRFWGLLIYWGTGCKVAKVSPGCLAGNQPNRCDM